MTPFGTIHFPDDIYEEDYINPTKNLVNPNIIQYLFVHEMVHVWQYQLGYSTFLNGIIIALKGGYINNKAYEYLSKVQSNQDLSDFNMEQQGNIIADYFIDTTNNYTLPSPYPYTKGMPLIESILKEFKNNPFNKQLLPRDNHV